MLVDTGVDLTSVSGCCAMLDRISMEINAASLPTVNNNYMRVYGHDGQDAQYGGSPLASLKGSNKNT